MRSHDEEGCDSCVGSCVLDVPAARTLALVARGHGCRRLGRSRFSAVFSWSFLGSAHRNKKENEVQKFHGLSFHRKMSLTISTPLGDIKLVLRRDAAPVTADYIAKLADEHKLFHNTSCESALV